MPLRVTTIAGQFTSLLGLIMLVCACSTEELPQGPPPPLGDRSIALTVVDVFPSSTPGLFQDSIVAGARVMLWDNAINFRDSVQPRSTVFTDSLGQFLYNNLRQDQHWFRVDHPHLGNVIDSVYTPAATHSLVEIWFP